jgi:hypothetical protein
MNVNRYALFFFLALSLCSPMAWSESVPLRDWKVSSKTTGNAMTVPAGGGFVPMAPCRVFDSRLTSGPLSGGSSQTIDVDNAPACPGISPSAAAYSLNVTVTGSLVSTTRHFLTAYPSATARPTASTLNFVGGMQIANAAIVKAGAGGDIDVYVTVATHVIIDINGYFTTPDITGVIAGSGLTGGGSTGLVVLSVADKGITTGKLSASSSSPGQVLTSNGTDVVWSTPVTSVAAGTGLTGGGSSGTVSLGVHFAGSGSAATAARSDHSHLARIVVVRGDGSPIANGNALFATLASISDASPSQPYLVKLEPGIYDLGSQPLMMKTGVSIEGSGEEITTLTSAVGSGDFGAVLGTVLTKNGTALRRLTIRNTAAAGSNGVAGYEDVTLEGVKIVTNPASASYSTGVYLVAGGGAAKLRDCTVIVGSTATAAGIMASRFDVEETLIQVLGGSSRYGVFSFSGVSRVTGSRILDTILYSATSNGSSATLLADTEINVGHASNTWCQSVYVPGFMSAGLNVCP